MKLNTDKGTLFLSVTKYEYSWANIGNDKICWSSDVKLLDVAIDNKVKFDIHIENICFKAGQKVSVLSRLTSLLTFDKSRMLFKVFFEFQFKYCSLLWMIRNRRTSNRNNKLHEGALRPEFDDYETSFLDLLAKNDSFTVHYTNIQTLLLETLLVL